MLYNVEKLNYRSSELYYKKVTSGYFECLKL